MILIAVVLALPKFKIIQKLTDNLNRVTRENLTGIRVVRAYNAEEYQEKKFERANGELTSTNLFANRVMALLMPTMTLVSSGISLAVYWIGAYLIDAAGQMERLAVFSDMVVFSSYAMPIRKLQSYSFQRRNWQMDNRKRNVEKAGNSGKAFRDLFDYCKGYLPLIMIALLLGAAGQYLV